MNLVNLLRTDKDLASLRDHLGAVLAKELSLPLKSRKLNELTAKLVGTADYNTAQAITANKAKTPLAQDSQSVRVVMDVTNGEYAFSSSRPTEWIVVDRHSMSVQAALLDFESPTVLDDLEGDKAAFWLGRDPGDEFSAQVVDHYFDQLAMYQVERADVPAVHAVIATDDGFIEQEFNASGYLIHYGESVLSGIQAEDFGGGYATDAVAEYYRGKSGHEHVTAVFDYLDKTNEARALIAHEDIGFSVRLVEEDVKALFAWLKGEQSNS